MEKPKISVILPVKNGGQYLVDAVQSISAQTFAEFELLVIDDGSTDATIAVLAELQQREPRLKVLKNPGAGLVDALNYGVASASAPLIARMDADDICLPQRLRRQYDFLAAHPEIAVVGTQVMFIDHRGAPIGKTPRLPEGPGAIAKLLLKGCYIRHPTVLFRRDTFDKVGGYRRELIDAEDYDLWVRISEQALLANLPDQLVCYRLHSAQVSSRKEWSQRLSRNLALTAAMERRRTGNDPITSYACFSDGADKQRCRGLGCDNCLCETVRAMEIAETLVSNARAPLSREDGWKMLRYVSRHTIGDGRKPGHRVLMALCHEAARQRAPLQLVAALGLALRAHPGRTVKWLMAPARNHNAN